MQFRLAEKSYAMAIWLGKQYLGQTDKVELGQSQGDNGIKVEMVAPSAEDLERVRKLKEQLFKDDKS